jgi:hypothetical protein
MQPGFSDVDNRLYQLKPCELFAMDAVPTGQPPDGLPYPAFYGEPNGQ